MGDVKRLGNIKLRQYSAMSAPRRCQVFMCLTSCPGDG